MDSRVRSLVDDLDSRLLAPDVSARLEIGRLPDPQALDWALARRAGVAVDILPLDTLHPQISGNKWFKLKYNLGFVLQHGYPQVVSCGGAHSNHLHALAWAGHRLGLATRGVIRGEEHAGVNNPTLSDLQDFGMQTEFVSRADFRCLREQGWPLARSATEFVIPEGGDNVAGVLGCLSLGLALPVRDYSEVHVACGTGCTFLGVRLGLPKQIPVMAWSSLRGGWQASFLQQRLQAWTDAPGPWQLQAAGGKFGRSDQALRDFMAGFYHETGVALDPVYTGKMMAGLAAQLEDARIAAGSRLLVIHSGGLQGARNAGMTSG